MSNSWIITFKPNRQAQVRLFCFPYAGTGVAIFRQWVEFIPSHVELCAVQLPGRENRLREPLYTRLELAVQACAEQLQPHLDLPYAFFGHSMGALIAFETTRNLRRRNAKMPTHLFVSGRRAPQLPDPLPPLAGLPESSFLKALYLRYPAMPDILMRDPELKQIFIPIIKADLEMVETYAYTDDALLEMPVSCYGGLHDQTVTRSDLNAWRFQTQNRFRCEQFDGGHFYFQQNRPLLPHAIGAELMPGFIG